MREMIIISAEELEDIKAEADRLKAGMRDLFTPDEMNAIREQHEARLREAEAARDELEWEVRRELARVVEAEATARKAATDMRAVLTRLTALIGDQPRGGMRRVA
jgi:hypothetical protein